MPPILVIHTYQALFSIVQCMLLFVCVHPAFSQVQSAPPSPRLEAIVIEAFKSSHSGWSVDEVLLHDQLRASFVSACQQRDQPLHSNGPGIDEYCHALLHVRKSGGKLPKTTLRARKDSIELDSTIASPEKRLTTTSHILAVAEIAARRLVDENMGDVDAILINSNARQRFDALVRELLPDAELYQVRKAAIQLRKSRRLEPELLLRVADWRRVIREFAVEAIRKDDSIVAERPGVYIFRDQSGYLYIGQAANLRVRLNEHLNGSDRKALADYLERSSAFPIHVELHIFDLGSPGENLITRRAYESDLIRTRAPRFNLAP